MRLLPLWSGCEPYSDAWTLLRVLLVSAAVLGHLYPLFAGFRGGKGIATSLGGVLAIHPGSALICIAVFFIVFLISHYVSLSSLVAAVAFPLAIMLVFREPSVVMRIFAISLCLVVYYTHRQNIARLIKGNEGRMTFTGRSTS